MTDNYNIIGCSFCWTKLIRFIKFFYFSIRCTCFFKIRFILLNISYCHYYIHVFAKAFLSGFICYFCFDPFFAICVYRFFDNNVCIYFFDSITTLTSIKYFRNSLEYRARVEKAVTSWSLTINT